MMMKSRMMMKRSALIALLAMVGAVMVILASCANNEFPGESGNSGHCGHPAGDGTVASASGQAEATTCAETVSEPGIDSETVPETESETVPETESETAPETESETVPETESETNPDTDAETEGVPETEEETTGEIESESETDPGESLTPNVAEQISLQFPLTSRDDNTSYVRVPNMASEGLKVFTFSLVPADTDAPELIDVVNIVLPADSESENNIQIIACADPNGGYSFICRRETTYLTVLEGIEYRRVIMEGFSIFFSSKKIPVSTAYSRYYHVTGGGESSFQYRESQKQSSLLAVKKQNQMALRQVQRLVESYEEEGNYQYTVLYQYMNGEVTINTPVDSIPEFPFDLFHQYGFLE